MALGVEEFVFFIGVLTVSVFIGMLAVVLRRWLMGEPILVSLPGTDSQADKAKESRGGRPNPARPGQILKPWGW